MFKKLIQKIERNELVVCIVGLGYVGLPLAIEFSKTLKVIGFDIDKEKINNYKNRYRDKKLQFTTNPKDIRKADFVIISVPTPVTKQKIPDLSYVKSATEIVAKNMKKGTIIVLESTVYPGVTEEIVRPILEKCSGMKCGKEFKIGYSPERINPGDKKHTLRTITKVISGIDKETIDIMEKVYKKVVNKTFRAKSIKVAEAAKVIENIQRDINIALMNELAMLFEKMNINIGDVIEAASTKWNFHRYYPGLVGGHCVPVDPYYLVFKAKELDFHPQIILSGRAVNDYMPKFISEMIIKQLIKSGKIVNKSKVLIMGLTYKENVDDMREAPSKVIIKELKEYGIKVFGFDPLLKNKKEVKTLGITLFTDISQIKEKFDCILVISPHDEFLEIKKNEFKKILHKKCFIIDIKGKLKRTFQNEQFYKEFNKSTKYTMIP